ncbi:AraC family transcriptional regulator ligand-binding domain-containing protein [Pontibacterium sp.]|uniref:helix-turn-helix transcriptional regulator n=1 Tax=Pontibacterium sp. TaxID=2036026 RepID=UPI003569C4A3
MPSFSEETHRVVQYFLRRIEACADEMHPHLFDQALHKVSLSRRDLTDNTLHFRGLNQLLLQIRKLGLPQITLSYYRHIELSDFGLAGYAVASSRDLKEAIDRSIHFQQLTTERFLIQQRQEANRLELTPVLAQDYLHEQTDIAEEFVAGYWRMLELLLGDSVNLNQVLIELNFEKPKYWPLGTANFPCQLKFRQSRCAISFPVEWLARPISTAAEQVAALCERECKHILSAEKSTTTSTRVRRALIYGLKASASLDEVAHWLRIHPRTLRAQIYREGTSFRQIALEVRMGLARQYLTSTSMQVKEIAYLLGYSQPATFHTAFCRFYGQSPGSYRNTKAQ